MLAGCVPTVVRSAHEVILVRYEGGELVILDDDDPLYQEFQAQVLSDPATARLLNVFEHTTEAFLATSRPSSHPQTLANKPMVILDTPRVGTWRNIAPKTSQGERVPVELAFGVGHEGQVDLDRARRDFPWAVGPALLDLAEVPAPQGAMETETPLDRPTTELLALRAGFVAALKALHAQEQARAATAELEAIDQPLSPSPRPSDVAPPPSKEAWATPAFVAAFFQRLLAEGSDYYPQRYMLWFANYDAGETIYGKVLLALLHMSGTKQVSIQAFIHSYCELFPAEEETVLGLASSVFGEKPRASVAPAPQKPPRG
ncbi:MAG: hypothetical protein H5T69_07985 [Chloroflexi bacterium]|nr:hypothetical protein [Chloroflexota bacterium]